MNIEYKPGFLTWLCILTLTALFFIGFTFSNILHFYIEDCFGYMLIPSFFFGIEYATSLSWLLILSFTSVILIFAQHRIIKKHPEYITSSGRKRVLMVMAGISLFVTLFYVVRITYIFLTGQSDAYGLLRIAVTLFVIILGSLYTLIELRCADFIRKTAYPILLSLCIAMIAGGGIYYSMPYGSPSLLRSVHKDLDKVRTIKELAYNIKSFYNLFNRLPNSLKEVEDAGLLKREELKEIDSCSYQVITKDSNNSSTQTFKLCTKFETNSKDARRLWVTDYFERGEKCQVFNIKSDTSGYVLSPVQQSNIKISVNNYR